LQIQNNFVEIDEVLGLPMGLFLNRRRRIRAADPMDQCIELLTYELRMNACASIAAAMISASQRPHSVHEALRLVHDVKMAMEPPGEDAPYLEWCETFDGSKRHI
jgi:hypothetical protein